MTESVGNERVGIVVVSHSSLIADGVVALAGQMAANVRIIAAGGDDSDGIGTSFQRVSAGIAQADGGAGAVILCDLGSALMIAETAREALSHEQQRRVVISDAPLVEGSVAAAVAAEAGADVDAVLKAASAETPSARTSPDRGGYSRTVTLTNRDGLHARPAAEFVKLAASFESVVTVNGKDARSLLAILSLGLVHGSTAEIAGGPDAVAAIDALAALVESGFGELPRQ